MENKVLNYLEWCEQRQSKLFMGINDVSFPVNAMVYWNDNLNARAFYSQSFKPEMITELFCEGRDIATNTPFSVKDILMQKPETLDEFIMYAKKYFTLTWKPEILNKYFK